MTPVDEETGESVTERENWSRPNYISLTKLFAPLPHFSTAARSLYECLEEYMRKGVA